VNTAPTSSIKEEIKKMRTKLVLSSVLLAWAALSISALAADASVRPELPSECSELQVTSNPTIFHVYAIGVQIYRWNGTSWDFVAPDASLFAENGYYGKVGKHYAGPTWESNSGSKVIGRKTKECTPNSTAIPWLLLEAVSSDGPGIFGNVKYIQRLHTAGGLKPTSPGSEIGDVRKVPYTAEYYFYGNEIE
jgi:hypothetical protein